MASTTGGKGSYPMLVELPRVADFPKGKEGYEGAKKGGCSRCKFEVWITETILKAISERGAVALCNVCIYEEKDRQSSS